MVDRAREAEDDLIVSGHEPRARRGALIRLLILVETAALAASIAIGLHYRSAASAHHHPAGPPPASHTQASLPEVTSVALRLPAVGGVTGTVVITAAFLPGADRGQFTVSAVITGGMPDTYYDLIGNDCSTAAARPDLLWAQGLTAANGTADLVGYAWTGAVADRYWLVLDPSPAAHPPGLDGQFAMGQATTFATGQAPCAT